MAQDVYEIKKEILAMPEKNGWHKEINIIAWFGKEPRLDIRPWTDHREKKGKGITLSREEAQLLIDHIKEIKEAVNVY